MEIIEICKGSLQFCHRIERWFLERQLFQFPLLEAFNEWLQLHVNWFEISGFAFKKHLEEEFVELAVFLHIDALFIVEDEGNGLVEIFAQIVGTEWVISEQVGKAEDNVASMLFRSL